MSEQTPGILNQIVANDPQFTGRELAMMADIRQAHKDRDEASIRAIDAESRFPTVEQLAAAHRQVGQIVYAGNERDGLRLAKHVQDLLESAMVHHKCAIVHGVVVKDGDWFSPDGTKRGAKVWSRATGWVVLEEDGKFPA